MNFTPFVPTDKFTMAGLNSKFMEVESDISSALPIGAVIMWSGEETDIPTNWQICDGTNNTPDLRNRFIVGAGNSYVKGATGGSDSVILSVSQMPYHNHSGSSLSANSAGAHTHEVKINFNGSYYGIVSGGSTGSNGISYSSYDSKTSALSNGTHSHSISGDTGFNGGSLSHENRPPYYALYYIMKIA